MSWPCSVRWARARSAQVGIRAAFLFLPGRAAAADADWACRHGVFLDARSTSACGRLARLRVGPASRLVVPDQFEDRAAGAVRRLPAPGDSNSTPAKTLPVAAGGNPAQNTS